MTRLHSASSNYVVLGYVAVAAVLVGLALGVYGHFHLANVQAAEHDIAERAVLGAAHEVRTYLDEQQRRARLFAVEQSALLDRLTRKPDDAVAYTRLEEKVELNFPRHVGFALSDGNGNLLVEDYEGTVGELCKSDLRQFLGDPGAHDIYIHPMPGSYHFDVLVPRLDPSGRAQGVFFLSMDTEALSRMLRNLSPEGFELLLVRGDAPYLVEVTGQGTREGSLETGDIRIDARDATGEVADVPSTRWSVIARRVPGVMDARMQSMWTQLGLIYVLAVGLLAGAGWLWSRRSSGSPDAVRNLQGLAGAIGSSTGQVFFDALTRSLAEAVDMRFAMVGELRSPEAPALRIWALHDRNRRISASECELEGTPLASALDDGSFVVRSGLLEQYPKAHTLHRMQAQSFIGVPLHDSKGDLLGLLAVMDARPVHGVEQKLGVIELLAARAGAELERLRVQRALEFSESQYRYLVETSRDLIWSMDATGRFVYVNQAAKSILGYEPEQMIGARFDRFVEMENAQSYEEVFEKVIQGNIAEEVEVRCLHREGGRRVMLVNAHPRCDENGKVVGATGTATNVTEVLQAQRYIKNNSEIFSALLSKLPVFFFRIDPEGTITDIRGEGLRRLRAQSGELEGGSIFELFQSKRRRIDEALGGKTVLFEVEGYEPEPGWWFTVSMFFDHWRGRGAIGFAIDVTERKIAEDKLVELVRENRALARRLIEVQEDERTKLSRELHDELGQSITAVKSLATAISRLDENKLGEVRRLGGSIVELSSHLYDVVKNIMHRLRPDVIDSLGIVDALRVCVEKSQLEHMGVLVNLDLRGDIRGLSEVVQVTIYRIVQECLTNVAKYAMASNVQIKIYRQYLPATERRKLPRIIPGTSDSTHSIPGNMFRDTLTIIVADDGVGMDIRQALERENRFSQGLGLQGIRERVTALGGKFEIISETGRGVQLTVVIDMDTHQADQEKAGREGPADGKDVEEAKRG